MDQGVWFHRIPKRIRETWMTRFKKNGKLNKQKLLRSERLAQTNGVMMYSSEGITVLGGREEKWENVYQQLIPSWWEGLFSYKNCHESGIYRCNSKKGSSIEYRHHQVLRKLRDSNLFFHCIKFFSEFWGRKNCTWNFSKT